MFGKLIRKLRLAKNLSLRDFCKAAEFDCYQWNLVERGLEKPPTSEAYLDKIAEVLAIDRTSQDWRQLQDLARLGVVKLKRYLSEDELVHDLPMVFRTASGDRPTVEGLNNLAEILRRTL